MDDPDSFGFWIRRRRKALDLTQEAMAAQVGCAVITIRKIEADERRPSRQIAERLAECLAIPPADRDAFLRAARAELAAFRLPTPPTPTPSPLPQPPPLPAVRLCAARSTRLSVARADWRRRLCHSMSRASMATCACTSPAWTTSLPWRERA